jgi:hypothetical protein
MQVVYKGRKKKTIQYFAVKSVEKLQKPKVLQEVSCFLWACISDFLSPQEIKNDSVESSGLP